MELNTKGRVIHKGPRGGFYVLEKGKKIYKFTRAVAEKRVVSHPNPKGLTRVSPLKRLLEKVRLRKKLPYVNNIYSVDRLPLQFSHFDRYRRQSKRTNTIVIPKAKNEMMSIQKETLPIQSWMDAQANYIRSLNDYDFYTAMSYTVRSHQWIGPYMRSGKLTQVKFTKPVGFIMPLVYQILKVADSKRSDFERHILSLNLFIQKEEYIKKMSTKIPNPVLKEALDLYIKDLKRIVSKAPPLPKTMFVYRGVQDDIFKGKIGTRHKVDGFASAAYVPQSVYAPYNYLRIKLLKGTRVLLLQSLNDWTYEGEFEVLVNYGSHYIIRKRNLSRPVINRIYGYPIMKRVTDVTVF